MPARATLLLAILGVACQPKPTTTDTGDTDPDAVDTDTDIDSTADCTPGAYPMAPVPADTCEVIVLQCDTEVEGTTVGGSESFDRSIWQSAMCLDYLLGDPGHLDAPERVFGLTLEADRNATVTLESPCGRMDMRAVSTPNDCDTTPQSCTTASGSFQGSSLDLAGTATGRDWEIIVDGYDGDAGNFRLTVDCSE